MRVTVALALIGAVLASQPARAETPCPLPVPAWVADAALPLRLAQARLAERPVLKIVAIGSSSTQGTGASTPASTYPAQLEALLRAALPGVRVKVINRGVGGEDAAQNLARFDADVLALRPSIVIWQAGANMAMRRGDPARFQTLLDRGVEMLKNDGVDVILVDSQAAPRVVAAPRNAAFLAAVRETAAEHEVALFPRFALMQAWAATAPQAAAGLIGPDQLHHTDAGYACMAHGLAALILAGLR
jgi:lysophospholipase L1-like esterase